MNIKIFKNLSMFFMYFIYQIIVGVFIGLFNLNINEWSNFNKNLYLIITDLIYLIFIIFVYRKELITDFKDFKNNGIKYLTKYIPIYILGLIAMSTSSFILYEITNVEISNNEQIVRNYIKLFPIYMTFSTSIYAPIVEEITFRKTFRNIINNKYMYILISGGIFGLIHITGDTNGLNEYLLSIPYILMGIDLSYIYYKSNNIFTTIIIHSMHNFILLIFQFIGG